MNVQVLTLLIQAMSGVRLKLRQSIITRSLMADGVIVRRAALVQVSLIVHIPLHKKLYRCNINKRVIGLFFMFHDLNIQNRKRMQ